MYGLQLPHPAMEGVRDKMLRCLTLWRDWRIYPTTTLYQLRQVALKGTGIAESAEAASADAFASLLQLSALHCYTRTPSGRKARTLLRPPIPSTEFSDWPGDSHPRSPVVASLPLRPTPSPCAN